MKTTITRVYDSYTDALRAADAVKAAGIPSDDVGIMANNADGWYRGDDKNGAAEGASTGASVGAVAGGGAGLLAGLGMLAIPGLGPVVAAGWLAALAAGAVTGAAAGGAAGGLIGALTDHGVPEEDAHLYAESVRRGGSLVTVRADDTRRLEVERILDRANPTNATARRELYRQDGWTRFDPSAPAYTPGKTVEERRSGIG